jgi:low temperature requirement protein LtrA
VSEPSDAPARVSTLELFFDLVFVFTITQLTGVLAHGGLGEGLLHGGVLLGLIFWMYDGYAWLTNSVPMETRPRQLGLLAAMATWLVLALAIPRAFSGDGVAFGVAYLVVVLIHGGMYALVEVGDWGRGIPRVATINALMACVVIAGGVIGGAGQEVIWTVAFVAIWLSGFLAAVGRIDIDASHFVERHGLIVIVTIGESIVAVGIGASALPLDVELVLVAVLGVLLSACLWWTYFGGDDARAERAMQDAPPEQRGRFALFGFGYCHLPMLLGIVAVAAGLEVAIAHPYDELGIDPAVFLAGGAALFLLGDAAFRRVLGIGSGTRRALTAAALLATIPLGTEGSAVAQLAPLVAVFSLSFLRTARR